MAFLVAQSLKLEPSPLSRVRVERFFSPVCRCGSRTRVRFEFTVRRPLRADATIVGPDGRRVRSLAERARWSRGARTLEWDGRDASGRRAPDGPYRLVVRLREGGRRRTIVVPTTVTLDTRAPRANLISVAPRVLTVGRRGGSSPVVRIRYRASESSRPTLLVDGRPAAAEGPRPAGQAVLRWDGQVGGRPVPAGTHALAVEVRDRNGNLSRPTDPVRVRVRAPRR